MRLSQAGLDFIKGWEGLRLEAYRDVAGVWTIGYGTTSGVRPGMRVTKAEAEALLRKDAAEFEAAVNRYINVPLSQNQFDVLVSFTYNCGIGALKRSTLRRKLNAGDYDSVPKELARWNKAGGRVVKGLVNRRGAEAAMWLRAKPAEKPAQRRQPSVAIPEPAKRTSGLPAAIAGIIAALMAAFIAFLALGD